MSVNVAQSVLGLSCNKALIAVSPFEVCYPANLLGDIYKPSGSNLNWRMTFKLTRII